MFSSVDETDWSFEANKELAIAAEESGFDDALVAARFILTSGRGDHLEAVSTSAALAAVTSRLRLVAAVHPGFWHPGVMAKMAATIDHVSNGRFAINVVSGWFKRRVPRLRRAVARPRRALPPRRGVHRGAEGPVDAGHLHVPRRLLPHPRGVARAASGRAAAPGDLPGRQLERGAPDGRTARRLVLHERQRPRRRAGADRGDRGARRTARPAPVLRPQRLLHRARHGGGGRGGARPHHAPRQQGRGRRRSPGTSRAPGSRRRTASACGRTPT